MSMNNNNPPNPFGGSSSVYGNAGGSPPMYGNVGGSPVYGNVGGSPPMYGNAGLMGSAMAGRSPFGQWQSQFGGGFQGQYSLSQVQAVARAQAQIQAQAQVQAQVQARAHAAMQTQAAQMQYQAQLLGQGAGMSAQFNSGLGGFGGVGPSSGFSNSGGEARMFPQKPPAGPQGTSLYNTPNRMNTVELTPVTGRMNQQSPERRSHKKLAALLPESALYTQLLEFENRLDAELLNKKHDIQEAMKNPPSVQKVLRIYIFNTFANQTQPTAEDSDAEPPTWTLRVTGRILEDGEDVNQLGAAQKPNPSSPKFSSFFKKVTIKLDEELYPDDHTIVWEQARAVGAHDGFEVKRKGNKEFNAQIGLEMKYNPKKFRLSHDLSAVLGIEFDTRARIIAALWQYVKARNLQDRNDSDVFFCDPPLQKVFGLQRMRFTMVSQKISPHLSPPPPINLEHWVKLSGSSPVVNACYDVMVDLPYPIQNDLETIFDKTEKSDEIKACDAAITNSLLKIQEHYKRRAFFLGFSQSPVEFIDSFIESQSQDLKLVAGESTHSSDKKHVSEFYNQPWVEDAVIRYLNRKQVAGQDGRRRT